MPVTRTNAAQRAQRTQDAGSLALASSIAKVLERNRDADLGTFSVRFKGKTGGLFGAKELTPEQAMLEFMAGNKVEATAVTWRNTRSGKGWRGAVTRTKVRNSQVRDFNLSGRGKETPQRFADWIEQQLEKPTKARKSSRTPRTPTPRSSHATKR